MTKVKTTVAKFLRNISLENNEFCQRNRIYNNQMKMLYFKKKYKNKTYKQNEHSEANTSELENHQTNNLEASS